MSRRDIVHSVAVVTLAILTAAQGFLLYRIVMLDTAEDYVNIPVLLGVNVLLYAAVLFIYLRLFIGVNAYKKISDEHR
ncbi:MAG: hypothetical protein M1503_01610 [Thaumarchaeota archaeon]|nr:hypothetical protein [Nitrososphaerota archaeon]MCL5316953.1 hypothetical protein [Nitrososphaerota archaeon]